MAINGNQALLSRSRFPENINLAICDYIMRNGCEGFKCKKCILRLACDHYPSHSISVAGQVLNAALKKEEETKGTIDSSK